jgi:hypothetical protein
VFTKFKFVLKEKMFNDITIEELSRSTLAKRLLAMRQLLASPYQVAREPI